MIRNAGVLTMTDLSPASEGALVLAGRIAERCGLQLDVLYALGLRGVPLRDAVTELQEIDQRITFIDRSVRSLIRANFPHWDHAPGPVIDVDNSPVALSRRAAQLQPPIIVLPSNWNDVRNADCQSGFSAIATISAPVLLVSSTNAIREERVVLLTAAASASHPFVRVAREWALWLQDMANDSAFSGESRLDVVAVEHTSRHHAAAALTVHEPSLVLIPKSTMDGPISGVMRAAVASFLTQHPSHILILPDSVPPPPRSEFGLPLVAAGA